MERKFVQRCETKVDADACKASYLVHELEVVYLVHDEGVGQEACTDDATGEGEVDIMLDRGHAQPVQAQLHPGHVCGKLSAFTGGRLLLPLEERMTQIRKEMLWRRWRVAKHSWMFLRKHFID